MEKFRFEPMDAQMDLLCLSRKITSHTEAEPSPALPFPAPSQISKDRAEGISSQKEYQDLILPGGKNAIKLKPAPCAWKSRVGREHLMEPHPYGVREQQEGDQHGRTQHQNRVWPRQSHPSLHKCGKTPLFPLWDYFSECYKLCCKERQKKGNERGKQKSLVMELNQNRARTGQGSSFVSWNGSLDQSRGGLGPWRTGGTRSLEQMSQELTGPPDKVLNLRPSSMFLQRGKKSQTSSDFQLFCSLQSGGSCEAQCSCGTSQTPMNTKLSSCGFMQRKQP